MSVMTRGYLQTRGNCEVFLRLYLVGRVSLLEIGHVLEPGECRGDVILPHAPWKSDGTVAALHREGPDLGINVVFERLRINCRCMVHVFFFLLFNWG